MKALVGNTQEQIDAYVKAQKKWLAKYEVKLYDIINVVQTKVEPFERGWDEEKIDRCAKSGLGRIVRIWGDGDGDGLTVEQGNDEFYIPFFCIETTGFTVFDTDIGGCEYKLAASKDGVWFVGHWIYPMNVRRFLTAKRKARNFVRGWDLRISGNGVYVGCQYFDRLAILDVIKHHERMKQEAK